MVKVLKNIFFADLLIVNSKFFLGIYIYLNIFYFLVIQVLRVYFDKDQFYTFIFNFPFSFVSGPFIYFHVREYLTTSSKFESSDIYHFSPLFIYLICIFSEHFILPHFEYKGFFEYSTFSISSNSLLFSIRFIQIFSYFALSIILFFNRFSISYYPQSKLNILIPYIILLLLFICLFLYPQFFYIFLYYFDLNYSFLFSIFAISLSIILMKIIIWRFPLIMINLNHKLLHEISKSDETSEINKLSMAQIQLYTDLIEEYLKSKPTRNSKFTKSQLISVLCLPEYLINIYFNQYLGVSFGNWKTCQRISDSVELIKGGFLNNATIEALAIQVGFSSRSRFVEAFTKINYCSPTEYHKKLSKTVNEVE